MARGTIAPALLVLAVCCAATVVQGARWTVGDSKGWSFGVSGWENGKPIKSGDVLMFKYNPGAHNVVQVGEADYNSCTVSRPLKTFTSGNDRVRLAGGGRAFFICSFPGHCQQGMKIAV